MPQQTVITSALSDPVVRGLARHDEAARAVTALVGAGAGPLPAVWSGIRQILRCRCDFDPPFSPGGSAQVVAWLLRHVDGPFTGLAAALTGYRPVIEPDPDSEHEYRLTGAEAADLAVMDSGQMWAWERWGLMVAGPLTVARVRLRVLPDLLTGEEMARIRKGEPCGAVIPGVTRLSRSASSAWPRDPAVGGHAVLARPGGPRFGFAGEQVTRAFIDHLHRLGVAWG